MSGNVEQRVVDLLERWQAKDLAADTGHGYRSAREIAGALGLTKGEGRAILDKLSSDGRIKRVDFSNGVAWKSLTPLPWERGGVMEKTVRHTVTATIDGMYLSRVDEAKVRSAIASVLNKRLGLRIVDLNIDVATLDARFSDSAPPSEGGA